MLIPQGHASILVVAIGEEKAEVEPQSYFLSGEFAAHNLRVQEM